MLIAKKTVKYLMFSAQEKFIMKDNIIIDTARAIAAA